MLKKSSNWFGGKLSSIFASFHGSSQEQPDLLQPRVRDRRVLL